MKRTYRSFAKTNLHLQVMGVREDGYHELRTVFQTLDLADVITLELGCQAVKLTAEGLDVPSGDGNLAFQAATLYCRRWAPSAGVVIHLAKRIPIGGGLGGGSSNAATVLLALFEMLGGPLSLGELWPLARELGADVPFFLVGGTVLGLGRGDELVPLPDVPEETLLVVDPGIQVSTGEIYESMEIPTSVSLSPVVAGWLLSPGGSHDILSLGQNDLEAVAMARHPQIREVYNALQRAGAEVVRLSGSGACLVARFPVGQDEDRVRRALPNSCRVVSTRTLSRSSVVQRRIVNRTAG